MMVIKMNTRPWWSGRSSKPQWPGRTPKPWQQRKLQDHNNKKEQKTITIETLLQFMVFYIFLA